MQGITDEAARILGLEKHNEGHWNEKYIEVAGPGTVGYSSFNDAGVECEVGEFLYAMVRLLKPYNILETGTHQGMGATYMGMACRDNGHGLVDTIEFIPEHHFKALGNFVNAGLTKYINAIKADVTKWSPPDDRRYQLVLLDTEPQLRFEELVRFYDYICPGGYIFIHDLHQHMGQVGNAEHGYAWPWGVLPYQIKQWVRDGQLRPFHFHNPRGLTGFYKMSDDDYDWKMPAWRTNQSTS